MLRIGSHVFCVTPRAARGRPAAAERTITIGIDDTMKYSVTSIAAKPGERLRIVLTSTWTMPKLAMAHNFLLLPLGMKGTLTVRSQLRRGRLARNMDAIAPGGGMPMRDSAYGGERQDWRSTLARSGLVAKGVLYGALGVLAMDVASGEASSNTASRQGAIELVASQPFGQWLLGILTFGLFALATWQVILAFTGDPVEGDDLKDRLKFAGKAVIYGATAVTALTFLTGNGSGGGGNASEQQATATIMSWPGGAWIVGAIGAIALFAAFQQVYAHGIHKKFMRRLDRGRMHGDLERGIERAGQAGYASRGLVALLVGIFLLVAAVQHDPQEVVGLSGALAKLAAQSWGAAALWFVAVGLLLYGGFCFAEARYRRAT